MIIAPAQQLRANKGTERFSEERDHGCERLVYESVAINEAFDNREGFVDWTEPGKIG